VFGHHADGLEAWIGCIGQEHAGGDAAAEVVDNRLSDHFSRKHGGNTGRIGADRFRSDPIDRLVGRHLLGWPEEGITGQLDLFQLQLSWFGQRDRRGRWQLVGVAHQRVQGADQSADGIVIVGQGDLDA
jgi:hypothetical protein